MSFPKSRLPPRSVADRQQGQVEIPAFRQQLSLDQMGGIGSQRRVAGKEAGYFISIEKIHICCASPAVDAITIAFVGRRPGVDLHAADARRFARSDRDRMLVSLL